MSVKAKHKFSIDGVALADKGFYINLEKSVERKDNIGKQIKKFNIKGLNRFNALTDDLVQYSCTKSHLAVFEKASKDNLDIIFVAEDDMNIDEICYTPYVEEQISFKDVLLKVYNDLQNNDWDILLFGCNPKVQLIPITDNLAINYKSTGAWAYLIKKNAYEYILNNSNYRRDYLAIDDYLPIMNDRGFISLCTIPLLINHAIGFESTLQPNGLVNYDLWIKGNYHKNLYENYENKFTETKIEKQITVVIFDFIFENHLHYLDELMNSLPDELSKCKFLIHYIEDDNFPANRELYNVYAYFRDAKGGLNVSVTNSRIDYPNLTNEFILDKIRTPHFLLLDLRNKFKKEDNINLSKAIDLFVEPINAVWLHNFEDKTNAPQMKMPVIFRLSKIKELISDFNTLDEVVKNYNTIDLDGGTTIENN